MSRSWRAAALLAVVVAGLLAGAPLAAGHESAPAGTQRLEISLGARELVVTLGLPPAGGGPMSVVVLPRGDAAPGPVAVAAVRAGGIPAAPVVLPAAPVGRAGTATLTADGAGPWEVVVADGTDVRDAGAARIPVVVDAPGTTAGWVWTVRVAGGLAVVALFVAVAPGVRRRPRAALGAGAVVLVAATVAVSVGVAAPGPAEVPAASSTPAPAPDPMAGMSGMSGMAGMAGTGGVDAAAMPAGAVVVTARTAPALPAVGGPVELTLDLADSSGGAVVDDLVVHDDALIHLAVVAPDGELSHVHPVRTAPGRYTVRLVPAVAGRYGVFAEMERGGDGGHQIARTAFDVAGPPAPALAPPGPGPRTVAGMGIDVAVSDAVVGRPARVSVTFTQDGAPVRDLQAWLGMAGHLLVLGPGAAGPDPADPASTFGHVHDMSTPGPGGRFGPEVGFSATFPRAGRYLLWAQVQRDWRVVTVPVAVDVAPASAT